MIKQAEKELQKAILVHNTRVSENQAAKRKLERQRRAAHIEHNGDTTYYGGPEGGE